MPDSANVARLVREVARRATGGQRDPSLDAGQTDHTAGTFADPGTRHHVDVARAHARLGDGASAGGRPSGANLALRAALRPVLSWQVRFNEEVLEAVSGLAEDLAQREDGFRATLASVEAATDHLDATAQEVTRRQDDTSAALTALSRRVDTIAGELRAAEAARDALRSRLDAVLYAARAALPDDAAPARLQLLSRELDPSHASLYLDLEDTFRGTREQVRSLVSAYLPEVVEAGGPVLDLGSGRNEWLELLREHDVEARGVDSNETFVADARARGLTVDHGDALEHLAAVPDGSLGVVTAFHLAEHLDLESLLALLGDAARALRPGGLLLAETPNPTNLRVGASSFYLDPTHLKPLHPQLLEFLVLRQGFVTAEVRYAHADELHEVEPPLPDDVDVAAKSAVEELWWALFGPRDYAVLARTATAP